MASGKKGKKKAKRKVGKSAVSPGLAGSSAELLTAGPCPVSSEPSTALGLIPHLESIAGLDAARGDHLLTRARLCWESGDWERLAGLADEPLADHPERASLAALAAAGHQQLGHADEVRRLVRVARDWGCSSQLLHRLIIGGVYLMLGRIATLRADGPASQRLLGKSVEVAMPGTDMRRWYPVQQALGRWAVGEDQAGPEGRPRTFIEPGVQERINGIVDLCLGSEDLYDGIDTALASNRFEPATLFLFYVLLAQAFQRRKDWATAEHFASLARSSLPDRDAGLTAILVRLFWDIRCPDAASELAIEDALSGSELGRVLEPRYLELVTGRFRQWRQEVHRARQHGQGLLSAYLVEHIESYQRSLGKRNPVLIEVGTTREQVEGQSSTRHLAEFCKAYGIDFLTVDMDPHCTRAARQMLAQLEFPGQAVNAKGEDFLRSFPTPIDFVFLDAYDFDHGKHSALRQSRYERFLGGRIDDEQCHRMHLECAESLAAKLADRGVVCIDDTWLEDDRWVAKGTLAVPYLLGQGFEVLTASNRAVLLGRRQAQAVPADQPA